VLAGILGIFTKFQKQKSAKPMAKCLSGIGQFLTVTIQITSFLVFKQETLHIHKMSLSNNQ
jgi:hypothetical protein